MRIPRACNLQFGILTLPPRLLSCLIASFVLSPGLGLAGEDAAVPPQEAHHHRAGTEAPLHGVAAQRGGRAGGRQAL